MASPLIRQSHSPPMFFPGRLSRSLKRRVRAASAGVSPIAWVAIRSGLWGVVIGAISLGVSTVRETASHAEPRRAPGASAAPRAWSQSGSGASSRSASSEAMACEAGQKPIQAGTPLTPSHVHCLSWSPMLSSRSATWIFR
jgi:hypothetical protein